ncbi:putative BTB/POZ domain-containing protein [Sesbania bispinosa]|nr:putative BTB/POZ domain-containing protein [Sesbania bispinosa]
MDCCVCTTMPLILRPPRNTICGACYEGVRSIINMMNSMESEKAKVVTNPNGSPVSRRNSKQIEQFNQQKEDLAFLRGFVAAFKAQIHTDILVNPGNHGPPIPAHKSVLWDLAVEKLEKHVYALSQAADKYVIPHLLKYCEKYLLSSLSTSNALETLEIADTCSNHNLKETTFNFLVKNIEHMVSSPKFDAFVHRSPHLTVQLVTRAS